MRARTLLAAFGVLAALFWLVPMSIAVIVLKRPSLTDLFAALFPFFVFAFYILIALRPCRAVTALVSGLILHLPLSYIILRFFQGKHAVFGATLLLGVVLWGVYVVQLRRHENATP